MTLFHPVYAGNYVANTLLYVYDEIMFLLCMLVVRIELSSTTFIGSESSGVILVSVVVTRTVNSDDINVMIILNEETATS